MSILKKEVNDREKFKRLVKLGNRIQNITILEIYRKYYITIVFF